MALAEVHQGTKPALRGRPMAASAFLLLVVVLLAANMSWTRANDPLAPIITAPRFGASFRPPKQFVRYQPIVQGSTLLLHFESLPASGPLVRLTYWRFEPKRKINATALSEFILGYAFTRDKNKTNNAGSYVEATKKLGGQTGIEVTEPSGNSLARSVMLENGLGYAVSIDVEGEPISELLYEQFDLSCKSFQFNGKPPA